jgi:ComF family protein
LAAILAPPCAVCGRILDAPLEGAVCRGCWDAIAAEPSGFALHTIARAQAIGPYEHTLRDVLHALKYDGRRSIAPRLAGLMAAQGRDVLTGAHLVVPVPLHPRRQRERGFNQAEELARHLGMPMRRVLRRVKATPPQVGLSAKERRANVRDAFAMRWSLGWSVSGIGRGIGRSEDRPLQGCTIVVVDDVATTGATLEACARVLRSAGAADVRALTAARVVSAPR